MAGYGCFKSKKSDGVAMASTDVNTSEEPAEATEEGPGKKKSKFQTFKKFFRRRRRKAPPGGDDLKCSVSSDDLSKTQEQPSLRPDSDKANGSEVGLGSRAQSHDSVFASDWSEAQEALGASQDSLHGKVKNLQMQLKQAMRLGAPPSLLCVKRTEDNGTVSEDDGLPCSPPEYTPSKAKPQRNSNISLDSAEEQSLVPGSSRAVSPLVVVPGDFSSPASASVCLDSSAARHKVGLRHRAQQRRRPATRLELKSKADSLLDDTLNSSTTDDTGAAEEELKDERVDVMVEVNGPVDSEEREETLEESCEPEPDLNPDHDSERERREEPDSLGSSPEPPAGEREYLLDPPGFTYGSENQLRLSESSLEEKLGEALSDEEEREREEEEALTEGETEEGEREAEGASSLLLEVLSSLKTPLTGLDVPLMDHHQRETEGKESEMEQSKEETQEVTVHPQTSEDDDNDAPEEGDHKLNQLQQEEMLEEQEVEADIQEADVSFYKYADDEVKSSEEESEEELEVEHFRPSELVPENAKDNFQEFHLGGKMALLTKSSDSEEEETQQDLNIIAKQISEQTQEEVDNILDNIEQDVTESEEEETEAAMLVQEENQAQETMDFKDETDENVETEPKIVIQNSAEVVKIEENFEVEEELMVEEMESDETAGDQRDSEDAVMKFESEQADIERDEDKEEASQEETTDAEDTEERDLTLCEMSQSKMATTTLEINLVSPSAEKHVRFSDEFEEHVKSDSEIDDQIEKTQEEESQQEGEMEEGKMENKVEILDKMQDDTIKETEEMYEEERKGKKEKDVEISEQSITIPPEQESVEQFQKDVLCFEKNDRIQDLEAVEVEMEESQKEESEELNEVGIFDKAQEEEIKAPLNEKQKCEHVESKQESSEKEVPKPEPGRPRFTVATAWQRTLSIGEKDETSSLSTPETGSANHKVSLEASIEPKTQPDLSKAKSETQQVQESRTEIQEVQESAPETQEVQESRPESHKIQEFGAKPGTETVKESPSAVEGITQNPFGVRLRRTQALQRFITEDEQKQPVQTNKVEPLSSLSTSTKQSISNKPAPTSQPITVKTPPPIPPITTKPSVLNLPITNKPAAPHPPISTKPVVPRKPELEGGNKVKRTSDAGSEPPSWIFVAKHKQKVYQEHSTVTNKDETEKTPESSKASVISLNLKPASPLSPPTPVPPVAQKPSHTFPAPVPATPLSPPPTASTSALSPTRPTAQSPSRPCPAPASPPASPPPRVTSPQDEPPWMALAKKKAKAWSEMPQIVQ